MRSHIAFLATTAILPVLTASTPADAGSRLPGGNQTYLSCQITCVRSVDGRRAQNYRICVNNFTGQTVSITPATSQRFCHSFP